MTIGDCEDQAMAIPDWTWRQRCEFVTVLTVPVFVLAPASGVDPTNRALRVAGGAQADAALAV